MMSNLKILITKLSGNSRTALEKSANSCILLQNFEIEIEHLFLELLNQNSSNDIQILLKKYKINTEELIEDLNRALSSLPKGNNRTPIFSKSIVRLLEQAWLLASADQNPIIRSGHLLIALLTAPDLYQIAVRASDLFDVLPIDLMKHKFIEDCIKSVENAQLQQDENPVSQQASIETKNKTPALDQFTINLTEKAKSGSIDPVIGREYEIRLMLDILMRRRQNKPISKL